MTRTIDVGVTSNFEVLVVGGGVIGLAIARALSEAGRDVLLVERRDRLGEEISSRNSEVIHAGIYYPPGSLRARLCVEGKRKLYGFARESGITALRCGKLLVARNDDQVDVLDQYMARARDNGVDDLVKLSAAEARGLEPELSCVAACLSPSTGVVDSHGLMVALECALVSHGGEVILRTNVERVTFVADNMFDVRMESGGEETTVRAQHVIVAVGLSGTRLGSTINYPGGYQPPRTYPSKGHYFSYQGKVPFHHLVYPLPADGGLGVHLTLDTAGNARFGPDNEWKDDVSYEFEDDRGCRLEKFEREIRCYWPNLPAGRLQQAYTGVRPKIYGPGDAAADFAIHTSVDHGVQGLIALYGIESPGLTSSLAIGEYVAQHVGKCL